MADHRPDASYGDSTVLLRFSVLCALMLGAVPMARAEVSAASPLQQCLAHDKPSEDGLLHVTTCYQAAFDRVDHQLNVEYKALQARLQAEHVPTLSLSQGQSAWHVYRDKWCAFEGVGEADVEARSSTALMCRVEVTQAQLERLRQAYQR